jgi:LuxR family transcriptional regulator, maltose regulon positive regulatory protein
VTLRRASVFVAALDARRSWFHYHQLFADLCSWHCGAARRAELPAVHEAAAVLRAG